MLVRFWGTRGSLPVAPNADAVRRKIANALLAAERPQFDNARRGAALCRAGAELRRRRHLWRRHLLRRDRSRRRLLRHLRHGQRPQDFGLDAMQRSAAGHSRPTISSCPICTGTTSWASRSSRPPSIPSATILIHAGHRRRRAGAAPPAGGDLLPGAVRLAARDIRVRAADARARRTRSTACSVETMPAAPFARQLRLPLHRPDGRTVIYSTDSEHKIDKMEAEAAFIDFFRDADLVICDTMYSLADSVSMKEDWGHSSNIVAVDLCHEARAKRLALFHHEPTYEDEDIQRMHQESIRYEELTREGPPLEVICAYDGLEVRRLSANGRRAASSLTWLAMTLIAVLAQLGAGRAHAARRVRQLAGAEPARPVGNRRACRDDRRPEHRGGRPLAMAALLSRPADRGAGGPRRQGHRLRHPFPEHDRVRPDTSFRSIPS